jgi:hypothetical protein
VSTREQRFVETAVGISLAQPRRNVHNTSLQDRPGMADSRTSSSLSFPAPTEVFTNLTEIARENFEAAWRLWAELLESHVDFASRFFEAFVMNTPETVGSTDSTAATPMRDARQELSDEANTRAAVPLPPSTRPGTPVVAKELPIKKYDELSVPAIVTKIERLRDADDIRRVLNYEARNKRRKGVATAGKARLKQLD